MKALSSPDADGPALTSGGATDMVGLMNTYRIFRPFLWALDAERAHDLALAALDRAGRSEGVLQRLRRTYTEDTPSLATELWGLSFPNCIGLAAGMDKNGRALPAMEALGFGFLEVGTVTHRPQGGNPKPRMWRLPEDGALINRLGFNNGGAAALANRLAADRSRLSIPLGINIGKNADTPLEHALDDYKACLEALHPWADYVVVNISSPNTPGLRTLQHAAAFDELLSGMRQAVDALAPRNGSFVPPLLVKVAPDLSGDDLDDISEACLRHRIDGIVATNTTIRRDGLAHPRRSETGGLSGAPLTAMSNRVVAGLFRRVGGRIPIVGVGGVMTPEDAYDKIKAGASLIQVLTGFVYGGPGFPRGLARGVARLLQRDGLRHIQDAVGVEAESHPEPDAVLHAAPDSSPPSPSPTPHASQ